MKRIVIPVEPIGPIINVHDADISKGIIAKYNPEIGDPDTGIVRRKGSSLEVAWSDGSRSISIYDSLKELIESFEESGTKFYQL